jgi:hypothetical protein
MDEIIDAALAMAIEVFIEASHLDPDIDPEASTDICISEGVTVLCIV